MVRYDRYLLNELIDSYERSRLFTGENKVKVSIAFVFTKKALPAYFEESSLDYEEIHACVQELEQKGFVSVSWKRGRENHILDRIILREESLQEIYRYLHRTPKHQIQEQAKEWLKQAEENYRTPVCRKFISYLQQRLEANRSVKEYLDITDLKKGEQLLGAVFAIEKNELPCYIREFSIRHFSDSKALEEMAGSIVRVMHQFGQGLGEQLEVSQQDRFGRKQEDQIGEKQQDQIGGNQQDQIRGSRQGQFGGNQQDQIGESWQDQFGGNQQDQIGESQQDQIRENQQNQFRRNQQEQIEGSQQQQLEEIRKDHFRENWKETEFSDILAEYNIYRTPNYVYFKGNIALSVSGEVLPIGCLRQGIGLSGEDVPGVSLLDCQEIEKVITIENLTTFFRWNEEKSLILYLGGYHNSVRRSLLQMIYRSLPHAEYRHFGDIDAGGFAIYEDLCTKTGIPFKPYLMDVDTLKKYEAYGRRLTENDRKRIRVMLDMEKRAAAYEDVLRYMLEHDVKLEQECVEG